MKKSFCLAGVAILCWSTVATVVKLLLGSLNSFQVLSLSAFFAFLFLLIFNIATKNIKKLKSYSPKDYITTVLIGLPGTFFYYLFYYSGTARMEASVAFIINYLWPIMSIVFACVILRERVTVRKIIAVLMSFLGVVIVMGADFKSLDKTMLIGAGLCVMGAISYGIYTALNQKKNYDKKLSMMFYYFVTFVLTSIINIATDNIPKIEPLQLLGFAWNGIFTMAIANTAWMIALESGKTAKISNLAYITPFLSLIWTALILKDEISIFSILGLLVIVLGILIQLKDKKEK